MKTISSKVGRITFLLITVFTVLSFVSCNKDDESPLGPFTPMKWQSASYSQIEDNGTHYYVVPSEGGTFNLNCENYKEFILNYIIFDGNYENIKISDNKQFSSDICDITIEGNSISIAFKPNQNQARKIEIDVQSANALGSLYFIQDASQK